MLYPAPAAISFAGANDAGSSVPLPASLWAIVLPATMCYAQAVVVIFASLRLTKGGPSYDHYRPTARCVAFSVACP